MLTKLEKKTFRKIRKIIKDSGVRNRYVDYSVTYYYGNYIKDLSKDCDTLLISFRRFKDLVYALEGLTKEGLTCESQYKKDGQYYLEYDLDYIEICFKNQKNDSRILTEYAKKSQKKYAKKMKKAQDD